MELKGNFNSIDTPEMSINLPETLQGDDVVISSDGDVEILYRGWFLGLHFDYLTIRGNVVIRKIERVKGKKEVRTGKITGTKKVFGFFKENIYETKLIETIVREKIIFEFWALEPRDWSHLYIIDRANTVGDSGYGYWSSLVGKAVNEGVILHPRLRQAIFGSIEKKLMEYYRQVKQFSSLKD